MIVPREHGAYGQLGFPMAAAVGAGRPTMAAVLLALACGAAFVSYEPLLIRLGQRGVRARREQGDAATLTLVWSLGVAVLAGAAGAWLLPRGLLWTLVIPGAAGAITLGLVLRGTHKSAAGEALVALTLSSCALPVGVAAGLSPSAAAACWLVFAAGFCAATLAVRATIARQRREPASWSRTGAVVLAVLSPILVRLFARPVSLAPSLWTTTIPLAVLVLVLAAAPPSARHLRRVGWALIGASATATILLALLLRE